jgi:long-subunit acyl-CoA synthetase (AMP-forming)
MSVEASAVEPEDVAMVLHTSGTTSKPKQVPLTHANMCQSVRNISSHYKMSPSDRTYLVMV